MLRGPVDKMAEVLLGLRWVTALTQRNALPEKDNRRVDRCSTARRPALSPLPGKLVIFRRLLRIPSLFCAVAQQIPDIVIRLPKQSPLPRLSG